MWTFNHSPRLWRSCRRPFSFYHQLIDRYWAAGAGDSDAASLHRLCTLARKMGVRSVIIDDFTDRSDVRAEIEHLHDHCPLGETGAVEAVAFSFLTVGPPRRGQVRTLADDELIGQAIVITFPYGGKRRSYVYEAVFRLPRTPGLGRKLLLNNYIPVQRDFNVIVDGQTLKIPAACFAEANGVSSVCGHAAVRSTLKTLGKDITTAELNALWGFGAAKRDVTPEQMIKAFNSRGLSVMFYDLRKPVAQYRATKEEAIWRSLAGVIESGAPALLTVTGGGQRDHVVSILGFTLNTDEWHPMAAVRHLNAGDRQESSSAWIDHLIIHDDSLGPYYCLSRSALFERAVNRSALSPQSLLVILPHDVVIGPVQADSLARESLDHVLGLIRRQGMGAGKWWAALIATTDGRVIRTVLAERKTYVDSLTALAEIDPQTIAAFAGSLPDRFWLCELTMPHLFVGNRVKIGELLIRADEHQDEDPSLALLGVRFPGVLGWGTGKLSFEACGGIGYVNLLAAYHANAW